MEARAFDFLRLPAVDRADAEGWIKATCVSTATTACATTHETYSASNVCCARRRGIYPHGCAGKKGGMKPDVPTPYSIGGSDGRKQKRRD